MTTPIEVHLAHRNPMRVFFGWFVLLLAMRFLFWELVDVVWGGRSAARLGSAAASAAFAASLIVAWVRLSGYRKGVEPPAA